MFLIGKQAF
jgi:hypothetical protein